LQVAIMNLFDVRESIIVTNVSKQMALVPFETDVLVLRKNGYAYGFEIKTSLSDLKADFKKAQHKSVYVNEFGNIVGLQKYFGKFRKFYFAVPYNLKDAALELLPNHIGLYVLYLGDNEENVFKLEKEGSVISNYNWTDSEKFELARLGTMRIKGLLQKLAK